MHHGFFTVAAMSPRITLCDCKKNAAAAVNAASDAAKKGAALVVLPELCLTGYTLGDLFLQDALLTAGIDALGTVVHETKDIPAVIIAGLPVQYGGALYNCAAVINRGRVLAIIPKTYIPNYGEFYEMRHFTSGAVLRGDETVRFIPKDGGADYDVPFGSVLIQDERTPDLCIGVEICEDLWAPVPPSGVLCLSGATIAANLSCSNEVVGKADYRRLLVKGQSGRMVSAYVYCDAGRGESTTDMVFGAHNIIAQNGTIVAESTPFASGANTVSDGEAVAVIADVDIERLVAERRRMTTFAQCQAAMRRGTEKVPRVITANIDVESNGGALTPLIPSPHPLILPHPFVPDDAECRGERCRQVVTMQAEGLVQRLAAIYGVDAGGKRTKEAGQGSAPRAVPHVVVGLSGGLDSTLALLVACKAFDLLNLPRGGITAVTMPCFGTTGRTLGNATALAHEEGASLRKIDIAQSVKSHLHDISLSEDDRTAAFENAQARERTQVLMDIANATGGIVIGTGDLSELALGWCTYNGDQMSMYGVNSSIPKTLVRHLVSYFADEAAGEGRASLSAVLCDILDTPVSPELLPPKNGEPQNTEAAVGPYELHDFFLYYTMRFGFAPDKVFYLTQQAHLPYNKDVILKWMKVFYRRFFAQQFKRSAMPDGAKVGTVSLSPRGDWRMPSDASAALWLSEVEEMAKDYGEGKRV